MNNLLVYFAIPLATVILSSILETFINCPLKVGGIFFSIFLVVAAALGGTIELLFAAIIYSIISFVTAFIVFLIMNRCNYNLNESRNSNYLVERYTENCDCNQSSNVSNSTDTSNNILNSNITSREDYYNKRYR